MELEQLEELMRRAVAITHGDIDLVPASPGIYTAWIVGSADCFYVGKADGLHSRLRSHFSGQRGSDQFCLYVYDRFVFGSRPPAGAGTADINLLTRNWIRQHVTFKCVGAPVEELSRLERALRRSWRPTLNPLGGVASTA